MPTCDKPVSEQTVGDALSCGWDLVRDAGGAVIDHPGGATLTQWLISILIGLVALMFVASMIRRPRA